MRTEMPKIELQPEFEGSMGEEHTTVFLSSDEILKFSPREMADYLTSLEDQGALDEFFEGALADPSLVAQFSYWEKWFKKDQQKLLELIIARRKEPIK